MAASQSDSRSQSLTMRTELTGGAAHALAQAEEPLALLGGAIEQFCQTHGVAATVVFKVLLALEELLVNLAKYGSRTARALSVSIEVRLLGDQLVVIYEDSGDAFNPLALPPPPDLDLAVDDRQIGGLGIHLVRQLLDEVSYAYHGERNQLTLRIGAALAVDRTP